MENTLTLSLKQQLKLSQMQIQKLEMLALSYDELEERIRKEEETNPFLEVNAGRYSAESTYRTIDSSLDYLSKGDEDEKAGWMERAISVKESLYDHLRMQIETLGISQKEKEAALMIASSLDSRGFLSKDPSEILPHGYASHAAHLRLNCTAIILRLRGNVNSSTSPLIRVDICIV